VRIGNSATNQFQHSTYGTLLHACHLYANRAEGGLPDEQRRVFLHSAARLETIWLEPDDGIWEERGPESHHTHSKMMSVLGLHCASDLARQAGMPELEAQLGRASDAAAAYVEQHCVDSATGAYTRIAGGDSYDAALLMPLGMGFGRWAPPGRVNSTIDAIRRELGGGGALLYRYRDDDGLPGREGFFTTCSFWLAGALAHCGRLDEAAEVLDELIGLASDTGLYSEEIGTDGAFLGNLPQAIAHASLVSSVVAFQDVLEGSRERSSTWSPS
jgi:GH15 family glucan-1,4-alpha-glucosidase